MIIKINTENNISGDYESIKKIQNAIESRLMNDTKIKGIDVEYNKIDNLKGIQIKYIPPSRLKGSRVKIIDTRMNTSFIISKDDYFRDALEQGVDYIQNKLGIKIFSICGDMNLILINDFKTEIKKIK